jgi:hypothetical protein
MLYLLQVTCSSQTSVDFNGLNGVISQKTEPFKVVHNWHFGRILSESYPSRKKVQNVKPIFFFARLLALRPLLAYCATLG